LVHLYRKEKVRRLAVLKKVKEEEEFRELAMRGSKVYAFNIDKTGMRFDKDFCMVYGSSFQSIPTDDFIHFIDKPYWYSFQKDVEMMNIGTLNNGNIRHAPLNLTGKGYEWWEFRFNFSRLNMTISGILFNIQQMKQEEEELRISREKVLESEKMKSVFLASMSHEIRTPLNAIVGFSNLIADDVDSELTMEQKQEFKQQINTNNEMLLKLFNDILDLSQLVGGQMVLKKDACDLNRLMLDMYNQYKPLMHEGVEMLIKLPEKATLLQTDVKRLTQVISNIVNNARKFTLKGHILIGYEEGPENGQVSLFIEDTGVGIPKELQEKIFGKFTKLDTFKQGTGIGLAISRSIILQMGGSISLRSELNSGSRFIITLPIVEKEQDLNPIVK
jgi:signal transduction histidine kinase